MPQNSARRETCIPLEGTCSRGSRAPSQPSRMWSPRGPYSRASGASRTGWRPPDSQRSDTPGSSSRGSRAVQTCRGRCPASSPSHNSTRAAPSSLAAAARILPRPTEAAASRVTHSSGRARVHAPPQGNLAVVGAGGGGRIIVGGAWPEAPSLLHTMHARRIHLGERVIVRGRRIQATAPLVDTRSVVKCRP